MKNIMKQIIIVCLLISCLSGSSLIDNRREARELLMHQPQNMDALLNHADPEIRRYALYCLVRKQGEGALPALKKKLEDSNEYVRMTAVAALTSIRSQEANELLTQVARQERSLNVRNIALRAVWPFHREINLLREDPTWDYEVAVIHSIKLPDTNWKFILDPTQTGHMKGWFDDQFDDSGWKTIKLGYWEQQGYSDYDGVAWYRTSFTMPSRMDSHAVEVCFDAVDESAWVWLNGIYLGCHDIGEAGWNRPFQVDCRKEINWGGKNTLVVRVLDTARGGGIWKPVRVDILK